MCFVQFLCIEFRIKNLLDFFLLWKFIGGGGSKDTCIFLVTLKYHQNSYFLYSTLALNIIICPLWKRQNILTTLCLTKKKIVPGIFKSGPPPLPQSQLRCNNDYICESNPKFIGVYSNDFFFFFIFFFWLIDWLFSKISRCSDCEMCGFIKSGSEFRKYNRCFSGLSPLTRKINRNLRTLQEIYYKGKLNLF